MINESNKMIVGRYQFSKTGIAFIICIGALIVLFMRPLFVPSFSAAGKQGYQVDLKEVLVAAIQAAERGGVQVRKVKEQPDMKVREGVWKESGRERPICLHNSL